VDRSAIFWAARLAVGIIGIVLMFNAARLVGRARAAANWPTAPPVPALSGALGWAGVGAALLGVAAAAGLSLATLAGPERPALLPQTGRAWLLVGAGALAVLLAGSGVARRLVGRAELAVLIRTRNAGTGQVGPAIGELVPPQARTAPAEPGVDPAVPPGGQSGWVYQDRAGGWYLAVATGTGQRLVRLDDFTLVPPGTVEPPLTLRGSVEISVYPVAVP
jgi:hypothetical protein